MKSSGLDAFASDSPERAAVELLRARWKASGGVLKTDGLAISFKAPRQGRVVFRAENKERGPVIVVYSGLGSDPRRGSPLCKDPSGSTHKANVDALRTRFGFDTLTPDYWRSIAALDCTRFLAWVLECLGDIRDQE